MELTIRGIEITDKTVLNQKLTSVARESIPSTYCQEYEYYIDGIPSDVKKLVVGEYSVVGHRIVPRVQYLVNARSFETLGDAFEAAGYIWSRAGQ